MSRATITTLAILGTGVALAIGGHGLFRGYFDRGKFEVRAAKWSSSPPKRLALIVERSDNEAMSGYAYFVLIGDHMFSQNEIKHAYHSDAVVFATNRDCVTLDWKDSSTLLVTCADTTPITDSQIDALRLRSGGVDVSYVNISNREK
jgi:hypothetical protein